MVLGLIAAGLLGGGAFFAGKSSSGGGIELLTNKTSEQTTTSNVISSVGDTSTSNLNILNFENIRDSKVGGSVDNVLSTKPSVVPQVQLSPSVQQGGGSSTAEKSNPLDSVTNLIMVGGLAYVGIKLLGGKKK